MKRILLALLSALVLPTHAYGLGTIFTQWYWGTGGAPSDRWVSPADVNGDGKTDLVMYQPSLASGYLSVRLSNGNLAFTEATPTYLGTGGAPGERWFQMADVTGDGRADAVLYIPASGHVVVAPANADSTFASPTAMYFGSGGSPADRWFTMADVTGDGRADAVKYEPSNGYVTVAPSEGGGAFGTFVSTYFGDGGSPADRWFTMADVNGDGRADAVKYEPSGGGVTVMLSNGNGSFASLVSTYLGTGGSPQDRWFVMADVNGDGRADAVLYEPGSGYVSVMLSRGDGSFDPPQASYAGSGGSPQTRWFVVADVNGDGLKDAVRYEPDTGWLVVSLSNGNGTFSAPASFQIGLNLASPSNGWFMTGDFLGQGKQCLALYRPTGGPIPGVVLMIEFR